MNHSFNTSVATESGILEAILLENIAFWVLKNKANCKHFHAGKYWVYSSKKAFSELFHYASEPQIKRALVRLKLDGWIIDGCFNEKPMDRTLWYSLTEKAESFYKTPKRLHREGD